MPDLVQLFVLLLQQFKVDFERHRTAYILSLSSLDRPVQYGVLTGSIGFTYG